MLQYTLNFSKQPTSIPVGFAESFMRLPLCEYLESDFSSNQYQEAVQKLKKFTHIIHLGTGGSSLGPQAWYAIADEPSKTFLFFPSSKKFGINISELFLFLSFLFFPTFTVAAAYIVNIFVSKFQIPKLDRLIFLLLYVLIMA